MNSEHLSTDTIAALAGNDLSVFEQRRADEHIEACDDCRRALERARSIDVTAGQLPREMAPPPEVWDSVRSAIAQRERRGAAYQPLVRLWRFAGSSERRWLAAAALLLVAFTASITTVVLGTRDSEAHVPGTIASTESVPVIPASVRAVEQDLAASVEILERALAERRATLLPETAATIEHSLAIIDDAIAEARQALVQDPADRALMDALSRGYSSKIDLLKRATELAPRT